MVSLLVKVFAAVLLLTTLYYLGFFDQVLTTLAGSPNLSYKAPSKASTATIIAALQAALGQGHGGATNVTFLKNERYTPNLLPRVDGTLQYYCKSSEYCIDGSSVVINKDFTAAITACCDSGYHCKIGIGLDLSCG